MTWCAALDQIHLLQSHAVLSSLILDEWNQVLQRLLLLTGTHPHENQQSECSVACYAIKTSRNKIKTTPIRPIETHRATLHSAKHKAMELCEMHPCAWLWGFLHHLRIDWVTASYIVSYVQGLRFYQPNIAPLLIYIWKDAKFSRRAAVWLRERAMPF